MLFPLLVLYHRIPRAKALDNANRQRVFDAIRDEPGIRVGTLGARLGLDHDTVLWHVRVLERFSLVEGVGARQRRYFAAGSVRSRQEKSVAIALSAERVKRIWQHVQERGEVELGGLVESLGLPYSTASSGVSELVRADLVRKRREGRRLIVSVCAPSP